jgi:hypothetical protein
VGVNKDGGQIGAQVTHSRNCKEVARKLESLQAWTIPHRYFFGPKSCIRQNTGVEYLAIEDVFEKMKDSHFLRQMLGQ